MTLKNNLKTLFLVLAIVLILLSIYLVFIYAPPHETMGDVQRIFYFHVASAWISYLAFGVTFVCGLLYLKTKDLKWDSTAYTSAEIGVIFCSIGIITGSLWAGGVWNTFWRWNDIKLFITLVLWLVFIAYLALRANAKTPISKARLSAVFGIIGFICIPLSFGANRIWQQYHPTVFATSEGSLQTSMTITLIVTVFAFTFLYIYLLILSLDIIKTREKIEEIKQDIGG